MSAYVWGKTEKKKFPERHTAHTFSPCPQESKGYEFESETDTETIAKLVKYMYDNRECDISFATLVERVTQQLVSLVVHAALSQARARRSLSDVFVLPPGRRELSHWSSRVCITLARQLEQGSNALKLLHVAQTILNL